jgi:miniconductance mechanosensitive channel
MAYFAGGASASQGFLSALDCTNAFCAALPPFILAKRFLSPEDLARLRKAQLIAEYIDEKVQELERHNRERNVDPASPVNGRHLTNIGTFRAYLLAYLKAHPGIHQKFIVMVRQFQPTAEGLPLEIYAFTSDTGWIAHENVQADIFDHVLAVIPEFGLRVFQTPSGGDVGDLVARWKRLE